MLQCEENFVFGDCECANEHCLGITLSHQIIESDSHIQIVINCTVYAKTTQTPLITRGGYIFPFFFSQLCLLSNIGLPVDKIEGFRG